MSRKFAVIGQPIAHSLSPQIHALFAQQLGLDQHYERLEVSPETLAEQLSELHAQGYAGLNATLPHKAELLAHCQSLSPAAEQAGAVNTLIRTEQGWAGDNTDGEGLLRDLQDNLQWSIAGRKVLILGAGGATRGILAPLLAAQPADLVVSSRNPWKPEALAEQFSGLRPSTHYALKGDSFDLLINATSLGHQQSGFLRLPPKLLADGAQAYDLNYGPAHQAFSQWVQGQGGTALSDGLGMLVEQAASACALWNDGRRPETAAVLAQLRAN